MALSVDYSSKRSSCERQQRSEWYLAEEVDQWKVLFLFVLRWERSRTERTDGAEKRGSVWSSTTRLNQKRNEIIVYKRLILWMGAEGSFHAKLCWTLQ